MTAAGALLLAMAVIWLGTGMWHLARPGADRRTRALRRVFGLLLVAGAVVLGATAVALLRRQ